MEEDKVEEKQSVSLEVVGNLVRIKNKLIREYKTKHMIILINSTQLHENLGEIKGNGQKYWSSF